MKDPSSMLTEIEEMVQSGETPTLQPTTPAPTPAPTPADLRNHNAEASVDTKERSA